MEDLADIDVADLLPLKDFFSLLLEGAEDLVPTFEEMGKVIIQIEQKEREFASKLKGLGDLVRVTAPPGHICGHCGTITTKMRELEGLYRKIEKERTQLSTARLQASRQVAKMYNGTHRIPKEYDPRQSTPATNSGGEETCPGEMGHYN